MRKSVLFAAIAVALVIAAAIAAGIYYGPSAYAQFRFRQAVDATLARELPHGSTYTYKAANYDLAANRAVLTGLEIRGPGIGAAVNELEIDGLSLSIDSDWAAALQDPDAQTRERAVPIFDKVTINGLAVRGVTDEFRAGTVQLTGMRLYPWLRQHTAASSPGDAMSTALHASTARGLDDVLSVLQAEGRLLLGVGCDSMTISSIEAKEGETLAGQPNRQTTTIRRMIFDKLDRGSVAAALVEGLTYQGQGDGDVKVERFSVTALDLRNALMRALTAPRMEFALFDGTSLGKLEYAGVSATPATGEKFDFDSAAVSNVAVAHGMPVSADLSLSRFRIYRAYIGNGTDAEGFDKLGLTTMTMSVSGGYRWNAETKTAAVTDAVLKIDELGSLGLTADLAGVDTPAGLVGKATLGHAVLRYTDASLIERLAKSIGTEAGVTAAVVRQRMAAGMQQKAVESGNKPAVIAAAKAAAAFLTNPHTLTIEIAPAQPMTLAAFEALRGLPPESLVPKLGIKVTANN
jgi:hypothetical protein